MPSRDIAIWMPASLPEWQRKAFSWHDGQVVARLRPGVTLEQAKQGMATLSLHRDGEGLQGPALGDRGAAARGVGRQGANGARPPDVGGGGAPADRVRQPGEPAAVARSGARRARLAVRAALGAGRGTPRRAVPHREPRAGRARSSGRASARRAADAAPRDACAGNHEAPYGSRSTGASSRAPPPRPAAPCSPSGSLPALRGSRLAPQDGLRQGGRGTSGARAYWFESSLVVLETALAVALLTSGALLVHTLHHLQNTDLGMRARAAADLRNSALPLQGATTGALLSSTPSSRRFGRFRASRAPTRPRSFR